MTVPGPLRGYQNQLYDVHCDREKDIDRCRILPKEIILTCMIGGPEGDRDHI